MKALVTGAAGFIGSTLVDRLLAQGHDVVGIDSFEGYYARELKLANVAAASGSPRFEMIEANILDFGGDGSHAVSDTRMGEILASVDVVFHLAAQPGVRGSWGRSFRTYADNNVLATQVLLEAVKEAGIDKFVYASSSSVYGDTDVFPMHEDARCAPYSPYGVTKYAGENLCHLYWRNFGVPTVALRFFTVYGPRQRPDMAFNLFMSAIREGRSIQVNGDGLQTRDFTFVGDIVSGMVAAVDAPDGAILNLGGGSRVTLREALDVLADVTGKKLDLRFGEKQAGDVLDTWASIDRAREQIGYEPAVGLHEGLAAQWEWE